VEDGRGDGHRSSGGRSRWQDSRRWSWGSGGRGGVRLDRVRSYGMVLVG
jgi:hypothetical protein